MDEGKPASIASKVPVDEEKPASLPSKVPIDEENLTIKVATREITWKESYYLTRKSRTFIDDMVQSKIENTVLY